MGFNVSGRSTDERFLSESSRSYMLAYYLSVFLLLATVLSTLRKDQLLFNLYQIVVGQF